MKDITVEKLSAILGEKGELLIKIIEFANYLHIKKKNNYRTMIVGGSIPEDFIQAQDDATDYEKDAVKAIQKSQHNFDTKTTCDILIEMAREGVYCAFDENRRIRLSIKEVGEFNLVLDKNLQWITVNVVEFFNNQKPDLQSAVDSLESK